MAQKHVAFAPASQKQLGSRFRSPLGVRLCPHIDNRTAFHLWTLLHDKVWPHEPCPLSLSHGFFTIQPSPNEQNKGNELLFM